MSSGRFASSGAGQNSLIGANEDMFLQAFHSTPKLEIGTQKKLDNELARVIATMSNQHAEWDSRVQAIKHFRSLANSGILETDDFHTTTLKTLEIPFQNNICDLRSQVVRETCITIAFLSCRLQQKFSRMAEVLLPSLIKLIPNSAKIVSTSALVAIRFIIQSTHNSRLITIIKYQLSTSKSKDIHRALCEIVERILTHWQPHILERQINDLMEVLRLGICDSDELARQYARRAFNIFADHFREPADRLFNSLDQQRQRMLNNLNHGGGSTVSMNSYGISSSNHLNTAGLAPSHHPTSSAINHTNHERPNSHSATTSNNIVSRLKNSFTSSSTTPGNLHGTSNGTTHHSAASGVHGTIGNTSSPSRIRTPTARSTSAIDVAAQRRARARAVYLSSMYTKPRQLGTINSPATKPTNLTGTPSQQYQSPFTRTPVHNHAVSNNTTPGTQYHSIQSTNSSITSGASTPQQQSINNHSSSDHNITPNIAQQQHQLLQHQQQHAASAEKRDGVALSKAASYLLSVIDNNAIAECQIVTTLKYFNSLIEKHSPEIVSKLLPELMSPLVVGIDNTAICVRKASVFAMVAIHSKVGLKEMESYLTSLTMTQRKLLEVYIKKSKEENRTNIC